jgi:ClpP class serine protease
MNTAWNGRGIRGSVKGKRIIMDIIWLFFMLSALQPVIKQRLLEASRKRLISLIEKERKSRVVLLVHRQETMSFLGFPVFRYIDINDSEEVIRAIHLTDSEMPLDLVLHTPGGLVLAATQIARAVFKRKGKVTVFVPHYAMSGGTLIALAADEVIMSEHAVLGPVDPQLGEYPAASIVKAVHQKPIAEVDDKTLILADQAEKALVQMRAEVTELLGENYPAEKAEELAKLMTSGTWTHDFPITYPRAQELGLHVRSDIPENILRLMELYPQPMRRQPSVEYVPLPYRSDRRDAGAGR